HLSAFHVIPGNMTLSEAQAACTGNYSDIVTVYSHEDNTELVKTLMMAGVDGGWIGLHYNKLSEKWSNGDPVTYRNLTESCNTWIFCAAMKADGAWESLNCSQNRYFMCYEQAVSSLNYHLVLENKNWSEAQRYCRRNHTDLVSISNQQQNEKVMKERKNNTDPFWIGLQCDGWNWADGGNSAYRNWSDEPQLTDSCVVLREGGNWVVESCRNKNSALCYKSSIHVSDEAMSWEQALDYCQKGNRTGFLTITSGTTQKEVEHELWRRRVSDPVWVGLRKSRLFGFWIWTNKMAVYPYSNWDEGNPPDDLLSQHCGTVNPQKQFKWEDLNCLSEYRAMCH
ncbi:secretory phospholipase A2 receptor, partial [Silurus asotus]